jgi:HSP20 family protein
LSKQPTDRFGVLRINHNHLTKGKQMKATLEKRATNDQPRWEEYVSPAVNVFETKDGYVLEAEMPGVNKEGLDISLEGTEITITGHRQHEHPAGETLVSERQPVDYRRVFELDPAIDTGKIIARMEQGVLTLTLPKSERVKPRKITISD